MKKVVVFVISIFILVSMLFAKGENNDNIIDNSKCLQFQIGSNFQLSSFQGSTISFKKHISDSHAYRIGFTLSGDIEDRNDFTEHDNDSLDNRQIRDRNDFGINITGQYLKYVPYEHSYFYYGLGPHLIYSKTYQKTQYEVHSTGEWESSSDAVKIDGKNFQIGVIFVAGVEIFISKTISLHGEYSQEISYNYYWYKQPVSFNSYDQIRKSHNYSFDSGGVKFGCSFYL